MDLWGVGCVFFEVLSLFPLFPGTNEVDQVHKIHNILGTPQKELLNRFQQFASHMDFNFPEKEGTGIAKLSPHISQGTLSECGSIRITTISLCRRTGSNYQTTHLQSWQQNNGNFSYKAPVLQRNKGVG